MKLLQLLCLVVLVLMVSCCAHSDGYSMPLRKGGKVLNRCLAAMTGTEMSVCCLYVSAGHTQCHITCAGVDTGAVRVENFACQDYKGGQGGAPSMTL